MPSLGSSWCRLYMRRRQSQRRGSSAKMPSFVESTPATLHFQPHGQFLARSLGSSDEAGRASESETGGEVVSAVMRRALQAPQRQTARIQRRAQRRRTTTSPRRAALLAQRRLRWLIRNVTTMKVEFPSFVSTHRKSAGRSGTGHRRIGDPPHTIGHTMIHLQSTTCTTATTTERQQPKAQVRQNHGRQLHRRCRAAQVLCVNSSIVAQHASSTSSSRSGRILSRS